MVQFYVIMLNSSTAQDRREMLEEIMRKGTSSLGTDVPSEREINRLAARTDEEFWLFEKMDEERRHKENYRARLMEEHEVPDWVYTVPEMQAGQGKGSLHDTVPVTGKRRRKEVIREDAISDSQWMKSVVNGKHPAKRGGDNAGAPGSTYESGKNSIPDDVAEKKATYLKSETSSFASEGKSEDTSQRSKSEAESSQRSNLEGLERALNCLTWRTPKRKRSSLM